MASSGRIQKARDVIISQGRVLTSYARDWLRPSAQKRTSGQIQPQKDKQSESPVQKGRYTNARRKAFGEIGRSGLKRYGSQIYEEFLPELRGTQGVQVYREMRDNDPIIGATMFAVESVLEQARWYIKPAGSSALDIKAANFLKSCMNDMEHSWRDFISDVCTMLPYGWAWFEEVYKLRKGPDPNPELYSKESDGLIGWRKLALRKQTSFVGWVFNDETGDLLGMEQRTAPDYKLRTIPLDKSLHFKTAHNGGNPEGRSILRNTYRPWYYKTQHENLEAIGVERDLVGLPVFTPPEGFDAASTDNAELVTSIEQLIASLRRDEQEGIVLPFGWELHLLQIGASRRQFDVDKIINRYNKQIAATTLAQFIMLGMDRVGSFALSKNQNDLFLTAVQSILSKIAAHLNRVGVTRLFDLNSEFSSLQGKYPRLEPAEVTNPNLAELADYVAKLAGKGFILPKRRILDQLEVLAGLSNEDSESAGEIVIEGEGEDLVEAPMLPGMRSDAVPADEDADADGKSAGGKESDEDDDDDEGDEGDEDEDAEMKKDNDE